MRRGRLFFFEKKKQKAFVCSHLPQGAFLPPMDANSQKFFGSFLKKRTPSLPGIQ
jgi:hypothetical protein